ncbi:ionotropic receptor 75a-like isoform X1 [Cydia fagiglandana]|uniref:ionotropic receptor 75a-like isoform X1 n=1 Tax=Cydia fagiglandana TaxID=1458189 RepID=UPI002FEE51D7
MNVTAYTSLFTILSIAEIDLIRDVFKYKNLHFGTIFHCSKPENAICLQKSLKKIDLRFSSTKMNSNASHLKQTNDSRVGIVLKTSCQNWTKVFEHFDFNLFKKSLYSWLIFTDDVSSTSEALSRYPIEVDSDVTIISRQEKSYDIFEVYNTGYFTNGRYHVEPVGYWYYKLCMKGHRRTNLDGIVLRSAVVVTHGIGHQTFEEYISRLKPEVDSLHKLKYFTLLNYLREMYNFSLIVQRTNSWGYVTNGSFDGMVGTLQRGETDVGGTPVFIRADRAKFIHYVTATWPSKPCFIFRHPKHPGGFLTIYTRPLSYNVWLCIIALLVFAGSLLCMLIKLRVTRTAGDDDDLSTSLALLSIWSAVCQQGTTVNVRASSVRLVLFSSFLFSLFVYQYYNALVVSTLLRAPPVTIRSLEDLLGSKLKAGVEDVLYNKDYFRRTTDSIALKLYSRKIASSPHPNFLPPDRGMALVKQGGYAYHADTAFSYPIIRRTFTEREICELQEVELFPPQTMFAVMKKGSPYIKHFSYGIRKMAESGLTQRLKTIWDEPKPLCVRTPDSSIFNVTLREFTTPLLLLFLGVLAATIVFMAELVVYRLQWKSIQIRH